MRGFSNLRELESGFAIALLMWMIAGMSLLVTAVIHFAQDDIGLAEQRLNEAKSEALARGIALLTLRDAVLAPYLAKEGEQVDIDRQESVGGASDEIEGLSKVFKRRYTVEGHLAQASAYPASGFISLDGGSDNEFRVLFGEIGGASEAEAAAMVNAVIEYRNQLSSVSSASEHYSGFRAREELLAVSGMRKSVYDRVKDFIQPYEATSLDLSVAPTPLQQAFGMTGSRGGPREGRPDGMGRGKGAMGSKAATVSAPVSDGLVTFESLNRQKAAALAANTVQAVLVDVELQNGDRTSYRVWVSAADNSVIQAERMSARSRVENQGRG